MPGRQHKHRGFGPWSDPDILPPLPKKKNRKTKAKKRYHHSFRVLIALGLIPTKSRQCDPFGLRLNTMHVMEGDCEKSSECLTAEGAPEVAKPAVEGTTEAKAEIVDKVDNGIVNGENKHETLEKVDNTEEKVENVKNEELSPSKEVVADAADEEEKPIPIEEEKPVENLIPVKEEKEELPIAQEDDDRNSVSSSHVSQSEIEKRKRSVEREGEISSGSESDNGRKRLKAEQASENRVDTQMIEDERERAIREFLQCAMTSNDEMDRSVDKLQKEVDSLGDLARAKETEWNAILRIKKLKEEMLERLLRRKRIASLEEQPRMEPVQNNKSPGNNHLMMVPIVSSSPAVIHRGTAQSRISDYTRMQRPILPKPYGSIMDQTVVREGRNGPVLDVKSIIADYSSPYRARHPENVPRRGRRMRTDNRTPSSPYLPHPSSLISMANMALGSGSRVRTTESGYNLCFPAQDRPTNERGPLEGLKEIAANFSKMKGPPPPYPEVTLHPVTRPPTPPSSSLLHGILTKNNPIQSRPSSFSPTLARLLTAPERPSNPAPPPHYRPQHNPLSSINDILSSSQPKSRNEITITPVSGNPTAKPKEDVLLQDDEDADGDRLVIDEGAEGEEVPQCQGCRQKSSQFVCAGCGNQWYCSRECQVTAWEEHSEICSG